MKKYFFLVRKEKLEALKEGVRDMGVLEVAGLMPKMAINLIDYDFNPRGQYVEPEKFIVSLSTVFPRKEVKSRLKEYGVFRIKTEPKFYIKPNMWVCV